MKHTPLQESVNVDQSETNILLDTEFNSRRGGWRIDPISLALITEEGDKEFYGVRLNFNSVAALKHEFLVHHVLPKLPAVSERLTDPELLAGVKKFLADVVEKTRANVVNIWARNGGFGDFIIVDLLFEGRLFEYMNSIGVRRTYFHDTLDFYKGLDKEALKLPRSDASLHSAIEDVRHERLVFSEAKRLRTENKQQPT